MITPMGSGVLFGVANGGVLTPKPTPWRFPVLQEAQVNIKGKNVKLRGRNQQALKTRRTEIDVDVKAKIGGLDPSMLNQLFFGCPQADGIVLISDLEPIVVAEDGSADPAHKADFVRDYGVVYANNGAPLLCSGGVAPGAGEYQIAAGGYKLNIADKEKTIKVSYAYKDEERGTTVTLNNQPQGSSPEFQGLLYDLDNDGKYFALQLNRCIATDLSIPTKSGAFWIADISFEACCDDAEILGYLYADKF